MQDKIKCELNKVSKNWELREIKRQLQEKKDQFISRTSDFFFLQILRQKLAIARRKVRITSLFFIPWRKQSAMYGLYYSLGARA